MNFNLWRDSLTKPVKTFKKEKHKANLTEGAKHIAVAGVISGFIMGLYQLIVGVEIASELFPMYSPPTGVEAFFSSLILTPIVSVIGWLIVSAILFVLALMFGGKGNYKTQSYLYAIYSAPLSVISTIVSLIPFAGPLLAFIALLYGLYLLTMALKEAHQYSTIKAVLTWLVPVLIIAVIVIVAIAIAAAFVLGAIADILPADVIPVDIIPTGI